MNPQAILSEPTGVARHAMSAAALDRAARNRSLFDPESRFGATQPPLRGKQLALLCEDADCPEAALFCSVARELGAQVSWLRPSVARLAPVVDAEMAAVWLGRLYDGIECHGLPPALVASLKRSAPVPVAQVLAGLCASDRVIVGQAADPAARAQVLRVLMNSAFG